MSLWPTSQFKRLVPPFSSGSITRILCIYVQVKFLSLSLVKRKFTFKLKKNSVERAYGEKDDGGYFSTSNYLLINHLVFNKILSC